MSDTGSLLTQLEELYDYLLSGEYTEQELEVFYPEGKDRYGKFTVMKAALTDAEDMKVLVKYQPEGENTNTFWYKNKDGSFYKKNPDFTGTFITKDGRIIEKPAVATSTTGPHSEIEPRSSAVQELQSAGRKTFISRLINFLVILHLMIGCPAAVVLAALMYFTLGCSGLLLAMGLLLFKARAAA